MRDFISRHLHKLYLAILLACSLCVYTIGLGHPNALFWDENYHIASAQKYIDGVMYMEPHPPLGKLLMAGSEAALGLNSDKDKSKFSNTDYLRDHHMPEGGIHYFAYRLPSALLMAFAVLFFYGIVRRISDNPHLAFAFSFLLIFDNALVIHSRSAMLEGIQLFFILGAIYQTVRSITLKVHHNRAIRLTDYAWLGVWIGLTVSVKVNGAVLLLLFVMLYGADRWDAIRNWRFGELIQRLAVTVPSGVLPVIAVFFAIFYLHIGLGGTMPSHKNYDASREYKELIKNEQTWSAAAFSQGLKDNWQYMAKYADGVPRLDVCKEGENGSFAMNWPLGSKTINYRWSKHTTDGVTYVRYHNIVANPIIWFSVVAGIVLSTGLILSRFVYQNPVKDTALFYWICAFSGLYISYMIAILQIERVMYLYHYLVPLVFGIINLALIFQYVFYDKLQQGSRHTYINLGCYIALIAAVFFLFAPFTFSWELTESQFEMRNWFNYWKLELVR
ncbi:phospholipid carrier-dependent glycosyltransferase [Gilvimarinus chinensis]|uniref:phospholipid carrier-dependent glycosyltransferase n=1 Tax=Gilvimarinus chinensis TaxID=396005 RepID=UPI00036E9D67|nr:phospholipid carrier-dependent glycosyltransferase [Gilvimarinus chinensis]